MLLGSATVKLLHFIVQTITNSVSEAEILVVVRRLRQLLHRSLYRESVLSTNSCVDLITLHLRSTEINVGWLGCRCSCVYIARWGRAPVELVVR